MKTHLICIAAGIAAIAAVSYPEKFSISISQVNNTEKINLHIKKDNDIRLTVTLRDANGEIVNLYTVSRKQTDFNKDYDFSQTEAGVYSLIVSDGHEIIVRQIKFEESKTVITGKFTVF